MHCIAKKKFVHRDLKMDNSQLFIYLFILSIIHILIHMCMYIEINRNVRSSGERGRLDHCLRCCPEVIKVNMKKVTLFGQKVFLLRMFYNEHSYSHVDSNFFDENVTLYTKFRVRIHYRVFFFTVLVKEKVCLCKMPTSSMPDRPNADLYNHADFNVSLIVFGVGRFLKFILKTFVISNFFCLNFSFFSFQLPFFNTQNLQTLEKETQFEI